MIHPDNLPNANTAAVVVALPSGQLDEIRLLGEAVLRRTARWVQNDDADFNAEQNRLERVLKAFRQQHGFGRAIAAPQIGIEKRFIALDLGRGPFVIVNPEIVETSLESMTLWDDCMSLPSLMVKVSRAPCITIEYTDQDGRRREWHAREPAIAELLQHEIDHLDGVLALDRAVDEHSLVMREVYLAQRDYFDRQVDYIIQPTV